MAMITEKYPQTADAGMGDTPALRAKNLLLALQSRRLD